MTRRVLLALVALLAVACSSPSTPSTARPTTGPSRFAVPAPNDDAVNPTPTTAGVHCGYVRWAVKTGADPLASQINLTPVQTTIAALRASKAPFPSPTGKYPPNYRRFPGEEKTVTITGTLIAYSIQQDNDLHLVVVDSQVNSIIAEIPNPVCVKGGPLLQGITAARKAFVAKTHYNTPAPPPGHYAPPFVTATYPVVITGVVFYDFVHGQRGVAPNGVEIHPVLSIKFLSGK